jgi:hypothetical protein
MQEDFTLNDFASRMVVQYFNSIIYRGDDTVDADTCKVHTQLHNQRSHAYFGNLMQYNTAMGERGLKVWAKCISNMAVKHGRDKFTFSMSAPVRERMLLDTITDSLRKQMDQREKDKVKKSK